jgi:DNA-binding LacI/PurR family transcriptional regulator
METPVNPNARRRSAAYLEVMEDLGLEPQIVRAQGRSWEFERIGCEEGGRALDAGAFATDTILCSNDRLAIGLLSAAYRRGLRVGRGPDCVLRIAGHDDHPFAQFTCPALTTVAQDYAAIAARSVETLLDLLDSGGGGGARATTFFDGRLIVRDSA